MGDTRSALSAAVAVCVVTTVIGLAVAYDAGIGHGPQVAMAVPVPRHIGKDSPVADILRFAETSASRWQTLRVEGHEGPTGVARRFTAAVGAAGRSRIEQDGVVRVRDGGGALRLDTSAKTAVRSEAPDARAGADATLESRMAVHRANDPTLMRAGERLVDTPANNLLNPAWLVRKELGLAAVRITKRGSASVAGRDALVLEVRFPKELAKEDHWDVYVDVETGILLGMVIEPLPGGTRYESFLDAVEIDPVIDGATFDTSVPAGYARAAQ